MIAEKELITIAKDALHLVAQISQGGLRDAESLLDQLSLLAGEVTVDRVWDLVGAVPEQEFDGHWLKRSPPATPKPYLTTRAD